MATFHRFLSRTVMPATLAVAIGGAWLAMRAGAPAPSVVPPIFFASIFWVAALERVLPYRADWNRAQGDLLADAAYLPLNSLVIAGMRSLVAALGVGIAGWISLHVGLSLWPHSWPLLAQLPLAWVVVELFAYWPHRWLHEVPWLWRLHATHHSPERLYWLNATRAHPLEHVFRGCFGALPLAIAGAAPELIALSVLSDGVIGLFQHANIDIRLGPLNYVFSAAPVHRWHHSRERFEADRNYGDSFIFWDVVFGTYYHPAQREVAQLGIDALDGFPRSFLGQLAAPFRWRAIERASQRQPSSRPIEISGSTSPAS
jgi:sterol desaturase/sphingolipid hydroxylase (fatty acid hydroxylase superfamily)